MRDGNEEKRQFWVILIIVFLGFLGISMPYLIFPALFLNPEYSILPLHWSESNRILFLSITLAAYPLGQFLGSPILGSLSDDYGRRHLLWGSLMIAAICNLFTGVAIEFQQLGLLIASRFTAGLMEGNIAIARAMVSEINTLSKQETFGKINAVASIAYVLGPLLGALMSDKNLFKDLTSSTPFYFICILFVFLAGLSAFLLKQSIHHTSSIKVRSLWVRFNLLKRLRLLFLNKQLQFLMITSTGFSLVVDIFYEFAPIYLTIKWGLSPGELIFYNGLLCLALAFGNGWLPALISSRVSSRLAILYSMGGFGLFLLGITWTDSSFFMLLLFFLSGLVIGLTGTLITVKISNAVPDTIQGEVMGLQISLRVLGDAIICLIGGGLLLLSSKIVLILAVSIFLIAMGYYGRKTQKELAFPPH